MEKFPEGLPYAQPRLNTSESMDYFIFLLSDLYNAKQLLVKNLPFIASRALAKDVKLLLLESGTIINGLIIRLGLIRALLSLKLSKRQTMFNGCLNLETFLKKDVGETSAETDAIILTHLIIAEGIEINSFKILKQLAKSFGNNSVVKLVSQCHKEAIASKKALEVMLILYR